MRTTAATLLTFVVVLWTCACSQGTRADSGPPVLVLWAWDRAEDLRFVQPGQAEIAALMETVYLSSNQIQSRRRHLPLKVAEGVTPVTVVRLESDGSSLPPARDVAARLAEWKGIAPGIQIDFDARQSQWPWYREMLSALSERQLPLSATALAGWCIDAGPLSAGQNGLGEVTPMLFRMGPNRVAYLDRLRRAGEFRPGCRDSIGVSVDEPLAWYPPARRVYVFNPKPWTREAFERVCREWRSCGAS